MKACAVALLLLARVASAQVIVNIHLAKPAFIAGEPIYAVIDVTNIGGDTLLLPTCCLNVDLRVPDGTRRALPSMDPCHPLGGDIESFEGSSGGLPLTRLRSGEHVAYESLLRGYALSAGIYEVIAEGSVDIRREPLDRGLYNETVQPVSFIPLVEVVIRAGSETDLRQAFTSYVRESGDSDPERRGRATAAIVEMAPAFLEHIIGGVASSSVGAIDALTVIGSREASEHLKALYEQSDKD